MQQETIIEKCYDYFKTTIQMVNSFPRSQRFLIGDRMQSLNAELLEMLIEAYYLPKSQKKAILRKVNIKIEKMRYYLRLCYDLGYYSSRKYHAMLEQLNEIGRMTGGWLKSIS